MPKKVPILQKPCRIDIIKCAIIKLEYLSNHETPTELTYIDRLPCVSSKHMSGNFEQISEKSSKKVERQTYYLMYLIVGQNLQLSLINETLGSTEILKPIFKIFLEEDEWKRQSSNLQRLSSNLRPDSHHIPPLFLNLLMCCENIAKEPTLANLHWPDGCPQAIVTRYRVATCIQAVKPTNAWK